jgi:hypothetical protein
MDNFASSECNINELDLSEETNIVTGTHFKQDIYSIICSKKMSGGVSVDGGLLHTTK